MKLVKIIDQSRRDFKGKYECQGCGHIEIDKGMESYDDRYFHASVIPDKKCKNCGESTNSLGLTHVPQATRYPDGMDV